LVGWLVACLLGGLVDWLVGGLVGWWVGWLGGWVGGAGGLVALFHSFFVLASCLVALSLKPWRWRQYISPKRRSRSAKKHIAKNKKNFNIF
jgi:hypothetical protein